MLSLLTRLLYRVSRQHVAGTATDPAWKSKKSWYLIATTDKMIPPAAQRFMAQRKRYRRGSGGKPCNLRSQTSCSRGHHRAGGG